MNKGQFLQALPLEKRKIHCIGIGGVGVSALAEVLLEGGFEITGSDMESNANIQRLTERGARISVFGHNAENLDPAGYGGGIMTAAAALTNPEAAELLRRGVMVWKRGEFLGELCRCYRRPVLVAGSHGKSSITAMLGWILDKLQAGAGLLLGAAYNNGHSGAVLGCGDILTAEADESDGTISLLSGELALISNIDGDHAWNEEDVRCQEENFQRLSRACRHTIYVDSPTCRRLFGDMKNTQALTAADLAQSSALLPRRFIGYEKINAALAAAAAVYLGFDFSAAAAALEDYPGIGRRQNEVFRSADGRIVLLEDYAHHPAELSASLEVIRKRYEGFRLLIVFQPHRYLRLRKYFRDFTQILSDPDYRVWVMPVFSAWEQAPIDALENSDLAMAVNRAGGHADVLDRDYAASAAVIAADAAADDGKIVIALIGAGDVNNLSWDLIELLN